MHCMYLLRYLYMYTMSIVVFELTDVGKSTGQSTNAIDLSITTAALYVRFSAKHDDCEWTRVNGDDVIHRVAAAAITSLHQSTS